MATDRCNNSHCRQPPSAKADGLCLPHFMLSTWLIYGPGETSADHLRRIELHDEVACLDGAALEIILRTFPWDARIRLMIKQMTATKGDDA